MNVREWALPVYTVLMQLAVGTLLMLWIIRAVIVFRSGILEANRIVKTPVLFVFLTIIVATLGAHFHLSKPFHSLFSVLNFRTSWLSREIFFTILFFLATGCLSAVEWFASTRARLSALLGWIAILFGLTTVYCMSRIYLLPSQAAWNSPLTIASFYLTTLFLGCVAMPTILLVNLTLSNNIPRIEQLTWASSIVRQALIWSTGVAVIVWCTIVGLTIYQINLLRLGDNWAQTSFDLLINLYQPLLILRSALPILGILWLAVSIVKTIRENKDIKELTVPVYVSCISVLVGEILGRFLFYATHVRIGV